MKVIKQSVIDFLNEPLWFRILIAFTGLVVIPVLGTITSMILNYT